ncbi:MAG: MFS transporter, partial [Sphingomonadaceae bacterium]
ALLTFALWWLGVGAGFTLSSLLCALVLWAGLEGWIAPALTFLLFGIVRALYGIFGCATPSATQAYLAAKTRRTARVKALAGLTSSFSLGTIVGPALAPLFVLPFVGLSGPLFVFTGFGIAVMLAVLRWLPNDHGARGRGAAMSYPSLASTPTGASIKAATSALPERMQWTDARIRPWIMAGVVTNHAMAAILSVIGFFTIDRLGLDPVGSEQSIALVMMAGAVATLGAQWGIIPRLGWGPRTLILAGSSIAAAGMVGTMLADTLYGIVLGFACQHLGFGLIRPGFTGGASLAVSLREQGGVAGVVTSANGVAFVAAPTLGIIAYQLEPHLPFAVAGLLLVGVVLWGWRRLA